MAHLICILGTESVQDPTKVEVDIIVEIVVFRWFKFTLNHLIQSRMEISHRLFGTLPIGLLLSNLDSRQLETSPMTSYDQF